LLRADGGLIQFATQDACRQGLALVLFEFERATRECTMTRRSLTRRRLLATAACGLSALALASSAMPSLAADSIKVGIALPITGADAADALLIQHGFEVAIQEANEAGGIDGRKIEAVIKDSGTATAGQYDPAQAATNTKALVADPGVVAVLGPEMSGEGKAMTPILSEADMATITPSSTNPDITDPKHAAQYMPKGRAVYFRTVTTDAFQGPNMANFYKETLKAKNVFIVNDDGAYGIGIADAFERQAKAIGLEVLGREQLASKEADYSAVLTKVKAANPDSIYYGGVNAAGVKLGKQLYELMPDVKKGGGDGIYSAEFLKGVGFPAVEGWYCTNAGPHVADDPKAAAFVEKYKKLFGTSPNDYSITAYDGATVLIDALKRLTADKKEINRSNVRDYIQTAKVKTLQGEVSFDKQGDINDRTVSVFQFKKNDKFPLDDSSKQISYIGVAPQS
jgi:branched-chain amino acid transport system substrate-binding protein